MNPTLVVAELLLAKNGMHANGISNGMAWGNLGQTSFWQKPQGGITNSDLELAGIVLLWIVIQTVCPLKNWGTCCVIQWQQPIGTMGLETCLLFCCIMTVAASIGSYFEIDKFITADAPSHCRQAKLNDGCAF